MFTRLFAGKQKKSELALIFDIGSDSVAGSLVHLDPKGAPHILYTKRSHWITSPGSDFNELLRKMKYTLGNVARKIQDEKGEFTRKSAIYVTLSAPWFAHENRKAELSRNTVFSVTDSILSNIKEKEESAFRKESEQIYGDEFVLVENTIVDASVNGYSTDKPIGKKAKHIQLSMYMSVSPKEVISLVEDVVGRIFHRNIIFQTSTLMSFVVSRDYIAREDDYVLVDVGGELTDILVVRKGTIFQTISFPLGTQFFIRSIAHHLKTSSHEAGSLLDIEEKGHLHEKASQDLRKAKEKVFEAYEKHLESACRELAKEYVLPSKFYLSGFGHFQKGVIEILRKEHFGHYSVLESALEVSSVSDISLYKKLRYQPDVPRDLFVALAALYRNHISS